MAKVLYFLLTLLESVPAFFGIRSPFEEAPYRVVSHLADGVEVRAYGPRVVVETKVNDDGDAFSRLFRYISGENVPDRTIAMTTPVEMRGMMTAGAKGEDDRLMRFFLPAKLAADPPDPRDPRVRIERLPGRTVAVLRFSGRLDRANVARHEAILADVIGRTRRRAESAPYVMGYDPPFTLPFLRRNEVAVDVAP